MKLKGYITIEATFIFTIVTMIVVGLIRVTFYIHDGMLSDCCTILGGIRYHQAKEFYYSGESIRKRQIANSPVLGEDYSFLKNAKEGIVENVEAFFDEKKLLSDGSLSEAEVDKVITVGDNANLVRAGGEVVKLIGGIVNGN